MKVIMRFTLALSLFFLAACSGASDSVATVEATLGKDWPKAQEISEFMSSEDIDNYLAKLGEAKTQLASINPAQLDPEKQELYKKLSDEVESSMVKLDHLKKDPSAYNLASAIQTALEDASMTEDARMQKVNDLLAGAGDYFAMARQKITTPDSWWAQQGVEKQMMGLLYVQSVVAQQIEAAGIDETQKAPMLENLETAKLAYKDFIAWCKSKTIQQ